MLEIHTRIFCPCGEAYYQLTAGDVALSSKVTINSKCPFCETVNIAVYEYDAEFKCKKWWKPWEKHYIERHFTKNEGNTDTEIFPRECKCGKKILLNQRRVK